MKTIFQVLSLLTGGVSIVMSPLASADFINDSKANLNLRNFYFNNDNRDGAAAPSKTEESVSYTHLTLPTKRIV